MASSTPGGRGHLSSNHSGFLEGLGWSRFFEDQLRANEGGLSPSRVAAVHRSRLTALTPAGRVQVTLPAHSDTTDYAVGDWVLTETPDHILHRRLDRKTLLQRRGKGKRPSQLIAANIDTPFIVASCNADFNLARLERYLALANDAGTYPVIVLTKADVIADAADFERQAATLQRGLPVVSLNARSGEAASALSDWCGAGATVALVGSSGVGKSTLVLRSLAPAGCRASRQEVSARATPRGATSRPPAPCMQCQAAAG